MRPLGASWVDLRLIYGRSWRGMLSFYMFCYRFLCVYVSFHIGLYRFYIGFHKFHIGFYRFWRLAPISRMSIIICFTQVLGSPEGILGPLGMSSAAHGASGGGVGLSSVALGLPFPHHRPWSESTPFVA